MLKNDVMIKSSIKMAGKLKTEWYKFIERALDGKSNDLYESAKDTWLTLKIAELHHEIEYLKELISTEQKTKN